jgi:hyperosmotically inducible protein
LRCKTGWLATAIFVGLSAIAPNLSAAPQASPPAADNTKRNEANRTGTTADKAQNNLSDRDIMQKIRKEVIEDKSLSTYAHNVKIIAQNGRVTLKGPVRSEEEKRIIGEKAADVAGSSNVNNEITIKPSRK